MGVFVDGDGAHKISNTGRGCSVGVGYDFSIAAARHMSIWRTNDALIGQAAELGRFSYRQGIPLNRAVFIVSHNVDFMTSGIRITP
jgi:hypothetical protein